MTTKTQKLLGGIAFLIVAIFAGVIGAKSLSNPTLSGNINIGYEAYEARIERGNSYVYFNTLSSAVSGASSGEVIEIISPVNLNSNITINKNLTINSMIMQGTSTQRDMAVTVSGSGGFTISNNAKVNFGELTGKLDFSQFGAISTSLFTVSSGTLEVMGGDFSGFTISGEGPIFKVNSSGTLNIYGGKFSNNKATAAGGVIANYGITNIYGGQFIANEAGMGDVVFNSKNLNIFAGIFKENLKISGGKVIHNETITGGAAFANIYGGIFQQNTLVIENTAGAVLTIQGGDFNSNNMSIANFGVFSISKNPYIDDSIYLGNNTSAYINFASETYIKPLNINSGVVTLNTKIAQKTSALDANEYIGKLNVTNMSSNHALVANGNNIVIGLEVTLNAQGGYGKNEQNWNWKDGNYTKGVVNNAQIGALPTPQRQGYTFKGWYTTASGTTQVVSTRQITAKATYHAQWTYIEPVDLKFFQIDSNYFETLQDAIASISTTSKKTITVLQNVYAKTKATVPSNRNIELTSNKTLTIFREIGIGTNTLIDNKGTLTISGNLIFDGQKDLPGMTFPTNGGAIDNSGTLYIDGDVQFNNNRATNGGAIYHNSTVSLVLGGYTLQFNDNFASSNGGAICNNKGKIYFMTVNGSLIFSNNTTNGDGGAIYNAANGELSLYTGIIRFINNNAKSDGGAIHNRGITELTGVYFISNSLSSSTGKGGVIANYSGTTTIYSTNRFVFNSANSNSAIIHAFGGSVIFKSGLVVDDMFHLNQNASTAGTIIWP